MDIIGRQSDADLEQCSSVRFCCGPVSYKPRHANPTDLDLFGRCLDDILPANVHTPHSHFFAPLSVNIAESGGKLHNMR